MAYEIGDPNHLAVHNQLVAQVQDSADAFGVVVTLPDAAQIGDLGHVSDHNLIVAAIQKIADEATLPKPLATGGDETVDGTERVHTFTANGDLVVTRAGWAELLVCGPGGWGNSDAGGGGGVRYGWQFLVIGTYPVVVAAPGTSSANPDDTSIGSIYKVAGGYRGSQSSVGRGAGGSGGGGSSNSVAGGGANGHATGTAPGPGVVWHGVEYGKGGLTTAVESTLPGQGARAGGAGRAGQPGVVIVRYEM